MRPHQSFQGLLGFLLCLVNLALGARRACRPLDRDCDSKTWAQEYNCLMGRNNLASLINCVRRQRDDSDKKLCQDGYGRDDIPDFGTEDYWSVFRTGESQCARPRQILIAGSNYPQCQGCNMRGLIMSCPEDDPKFWECLCHYNIMPSHLECLAYCFNGGSLEGLSGLSGLHCKHWGNHRVVARRDSIKPPVEASWSHVDTRIVYHWDDQVSIDKGGWSCFNNDDDPYDGVCTLGFEKIPYRDGRPNEDGWFRRCFVHPLKSQRRCFRLRSDLHGRSTPDSPTDEVDDGYATFDSSETIDDDIFIGTRAPPRMATSPISAITPTRAGRTASLRQPTPP